MTPEKYQCIVDDCKTKEDLNNLRDNTLRNNRPELLAIVQKALAERFPYQNQLKPTSGKSKTTIPFEIIKENYKSHPSLNREQIEFLAKHVVPEKHVFNANGLLTADYTQKMSEEGYVVAYGTFACGKEGHTLRTSSGACVQCHPSKISYTLRHRNSGEVYVAESNTEPKIIKVGCSESTNSRISGLNSEQYAGRRDWIMKYHYGVQQMGLVESEIHAALDSYAINNKFYFKNGARTLCREIFSCSFEVTLDALKKIIAKHS